ncbi:RNA-binding protein CP31B, chloroplastic [Melia azedarach]|uniref:RNA-binding protein CP31B, chloroplastic n=2 Tax=Melia azedarach TaxID=155640 RepID=A0ACC1YW23_MELAZ|nr:RNA-binding protein CP31B, chloroplastic [Melia azedarach]KAJ4728020.1 RNA-binding protein CP31B, chloroplastic [Melia azedarach]
MAAPATTGCLTFCSPSLFTKTTTPSIPIPKRLLSFSFPTLINFHYPKLSSCCSPSQTARFCSVLAVVEEEAVVVEDEINREDNADGNEVKDDATVQESKNRARPCELYVCNLPRSCDIPELLEMFKPFGSVISVEVSKNPETGISRGCGYVTMGSINSAKNAIAALDGSDVGGREMRVRYSVDMTFRKRNPEALTSSPKKTFIYESPYKLYVGNLIWTTKPEDLRNHFCQFGTVVSARVLHDRKGGNNRVFGFISFSSVAERDAALSMNGTEFRGRKLIVREGVDRTEP